MWAKLKRFWLAETRIGRRLSHRRRFPGLLVHDEARISGIGQLGYGQGASIGSDARILLAEGSLLELGSGSYVGRQVEIAPGGQISLGRSVSVQDRCVILGDVSIGAYTTLAYNIYISSGNHSIDAIPAIPVKVQDIWAPTPSRPVVIDEDCWIGYGAFIKSGVHLGRGAVVGANAVVTRDVPPYCVVAGAPARTLRKRFHFKPPTELTLDGDASLPYFYQGFHMLGSELAEARANGSIVCGGNFTLALDGAGRSRIHVEVATADGASVELIHGGEQVAIGSDFGIAEFDVTRGALLHRFRVSAPHALRIRRAWVS